MDNDTHTDRRPPATLGSWPELDEFLHFAAEQLALDAHDLVEAVRSDSPAPRASGRTPRDLPGPPEHDLT